MEKTYEVTGMKCQGCVKTVTEKLSAVRGVEKVVVDLDKKTSNRHRKSFQALPKTSTQGNKIHTWKRNLKEFQKSKKNRLSAVFFCVKNDKLV